MLGAIIGDIVGSRFEWHNRKSKKFRLFTSDCKPTDDSVMTLAVAKAILSCDGDYSGLTDQTVNCMQELGRRYPYAGYGGRFKQWLKENHPQPYNSYGNGSAMRVSPCAYAADTLDEVKALSRVVSETTHNHPEGIKGAEAVVTAVFMARHGSSIDEIREIINNEYYAMNFTLDEIRPKYKFDSSCQGSVPQAIMAFLESTDFEDAIRNAVSIGGDSDTIASIAGSIAGAYYGIPINYRLQAWDYLDSFQSDIVHKFKETYGCVKEWDCPEPRTKEEEGQSVLEALRRIAPKLVRRNILEKLPIPKPDLEGRDLVDELIYEQQLIRQIYDLEAEMTSWLTEQEEQKKKSVFEHTLELAQGGDVDAQRKLCEFYQTGFGTQVSEQSAFQWMLKAAQSGDIKAQRKVGTFFHDGFGTEKNEEQAFYWYMCAAEQGNSTAQNRIGDYYSRGVGVQQDLEAALVWYLKAAEQGSSRAQKRIGDCYSRGTGVQQNLETAFEWYLKAAENGDRVAKYLVGLCYYEGTGVMRDIQLAFQWMTAAAPKHGSAQKFLKEHQEEFLQLRGEGS